MLSTLYTILGSERGRAHQTLQYVMTNFKIQTMAIKAIRRTDLSDATGVQYVHNIIFSSKDKTHNAPPK